MSRIISMALVACLGAALSVAAVAAPTTAPAPATSPVATGAAAATATAPTRSGRLAINGVDYYYEVRGKGEPLLLLHGGLGSIAMFGPVLESLVAGREVIAVDLQGHGHTALGERSFRLQDMGDDMAALVRKLGYTQVDVLGYSLGGGVAFRMAAQNPAQVRRLVMVSTAFSDEGYYADVRVQQNALTPAMAPMMAGTPMYASYAAVAPKVEEFPRLLGVVGDFMRAKYDWSADVAKLTMPVMLVYGDGDMLRPEHEVAFYQLLGGGLRDAGWGREAMSRNRLAILPDLTHYEIFASPRLVSAVLPFLDGRSDVKSWAQQADAAR
ncbi:alpha/beta fold hydrolase [Montanilutibacter psychrotolerans]|uniref:Alpha/beta hydrolase n=1 Tax=Montanilutibacter psychrotolerans TaxID=1327343 RepID=A0A3M8SPF0_9GAMM|nr:alpha/beta hydrolase [Lysobacter psychrotolerans]RNF82555.1 alpha/beta hydrolase [Lysobacter psychrotolerans]